MTSRLRAGRLLGAVLLTFASSVPRSAGSVANPGQPVRVSDPAVYERILARLRGGEPYYNAVGQELRDNGYATREVFNWRTPLLWKSLAPLPGAIRRGLLIALGVAVGIVATITSLRRSSTAAVVTGIAAIGVGLVMSAPASVGMGEAWAGGLIGLSIAAYAHGRNWTGVGLGLAAMFVRELVAPFALICTVLAARRARWREVTAWLLGGVAYAVYYGVHVSQIDAHRLPADLPGSGSWIAWGGLTFVLSTVQWNGLLLLAPWLLVALALSLIVAGVLSDRSPVHLRWTAGLYAAMFLVIGQPFDRYWGLLTWPTWMLACGFGADAIAKALYTVIGGGAASQAVERRESPR